MLDRADAILKLALAVAAICLGCGVGYYYAVFLPSQAAAADQRVAAAEKVKAEVERHSIEAKSAAELAAKNIYQICVGAANIDYSSRWNTSCGSQHEADVKAKQNCNAQGLSEQYCGTFVVRPATSCALPSITAEAYESTVKEAKRICLEALKVGI